MDDIDVIDEVRAENPYPASVFHEPTDEEWLAFHKALKKDGLIGEPYMGSMGRLAWNNACDKVKEALTGRRD